MINRILLAFATFVVFIVAGCQPAPEEKPIEGSVASPGKPPESAIPNSVQPKEGGGEKAQAVEMAKCDNCGMEVPKAELTSHDGKMFCKHCMESHTHG